MISLSCCCFAVPFVLQGEEKSKCCCKRWRRLKEIGLEVLKIRETADSVLLMKFSPIILLSRKTK
jgi:hypothetical protein